MTAVGQHRFFAEQVDPADGGDAAGGDDRETLRAALVEMQARAEAAEQRVAKFQRFVANQGDQMDALAESLALSESIVRHLPEPMLVVGTDGVASYANEHFAALCGLERAAIEGHLREEQVWTYLADGQPVLGACLQRAQGDDLRSEGRTVQTRDGRRVSLLVSVGQRRTSVGELRGAFAIFRDVTQTERLTARLVEAGERVQDVHTSAAEILATSREQVTTATEQATTVAQVTTTTQELAATASQVAEACVAIAAATAQLVDTAREGSDIQATARKSIGKLRELSHEASREVSGLGDRTGRIEVVVDLIGRVAAETRLIAFNAAIEAARAGEAGRGFGVVASEVKSLAERVEASSTEIKTMVADIRTSTNTTILKAEGQLKLMEEVGEISHRSSTAFGEIVTAIAAVAGRAGEISGSSQQQKLAIDQLSASMEELSKAASISASSAQETIAAVSMLTDFAAQLGEAMSRYKQEQ